jgi:hypothetical protein
LTFEDAPNTFIVVPLGAFAIETSKAQCRLYIQQLNSTVNPNSEAIILGTMFLQQFDAYFEYNYGEVTSQMNL